MDTPKQNNYGNRRKPKEPDVIDLAGRKPPSDITVEAAVLGALMISADAFPMVCDMLRPESFYDPAHRLIYDAIQTLGVSNQRIDMLTVIHQLERNNTLEEAGGRTAIVSLTTNVSSAAHIEYHARIVMQKYLARELVKYGAEVQTKAFDESNDIEEVLQETEGTLFELAQRNVKKEVTQIDPIISQALEKMKDAASRESGLSGLESGYRELDRITSGWQNSDLIIIAARPAMGKTAFVLSMAKNMAVNYNTPVAIFSLEMSNLQLVNRLISNVCELEGSKIKSGQLSDLEWQQVTHRLNHLYSAPLYVDDTPSLSISELRSKARRLVREKNVKFIIIDYLQLMNATGMKYGSREQEVSLISRSLKQLAKELNIPIVALSQLNRSVESRDKSKRPQLADLRESGAIEQDADMVCFIHRPEYYNRSGEDAEGNDIRGLAEFIIAKHRSGAVDDVKMRFRANFARFENWDDNAPTVMSEVRSRINTNEEDIPTGNPFGGGTSDISAPPEEVIPF